MGFFIKYILPIIFCFFTLSSYFTYDPLFMTIMSFSNMAIFWWIGRIYENERG